MQTSWSSVAFAQRLYDILWDVSTSSIRCPSAVGRAVNVQCMYCERRESVVGVQRIANKNSVGMQ